MILLGVANCFLCGTRKFGFPSMTTIFFLWIRKDVVGRLFECKAYVFWAVTPIDASKEGCLLFQTPMVYGHNGRVKLEDRPNTIDRCGWLVPMGWCVKIPWPTFFCTNPKKKFKQGWPDRGSPPIYSKVSLYVMVGEAGERGRLQFFKQNFLGKKALQYACWNWFLVTCIGYLQSQLGEILNQPGIEIIKFAYHT